MNNESDKILLQLLAAVVICCAAASLGIAALAFCLIRDLSGSTMTAVAAMVAAPSVMGIAAAEFMTKRWNSDGKPAEARR